MHSKIKIQIRAIVHTKDGRTFKKYPWKNANSLIKAFIQILMIQMSQAAQTIKDTAGNSASHSVSAQALAVIAAINFTDRGIVIGTGTTPVTMTDWKLETQVIANVAHAAEIIALENPNAATWRINVSRIFTNNTGGVLSIKEVALYSDDTGLGYTSCIDRTLYAVDVPNTYPITFQYRITITL